MGDYVSGEDAMMLAEAVREAEAFKAHRCPKATFTGKDGAGHRDPDTEDNDHWPSLVSRMYEGFRQMTEDGNGYFD